MTHLERMLFSWIIRANGFALIGERVGLSFGVVTARKQSRERGLKIYKKEEKIIWFIFSLPKTEDTK